MKQILLTLLFTVSTTISLASAQRVIEQQDPCKAKTKIVADVDYCDRYWECVAGTPELYDCPNGLVWVGKNRGIADGCDYPWRNPTLCQDKDLANPPQSTEHCDWLYGIFGHETSCTRYWTCWNGTATEQFCVGGLLYNEETHACDWPQNVLGCQKHPLCKDDANGNVPLGKSCNRYWACQGGYPRLHRCPAMLVFDKQRKQCVAPPTADCDIPSTTPAPEDDEENNNNDGQPRNNRRPGNKRRSQEKQGGRPLPPQFELPAGATLLSSPNDNN